MNTARHPHTGAGCTSAHVIPMALHRGFAPRLFALDLQFASGARFVGTVEAISRDQAEEIAADKLHESVDTLLGGSSRPMPLAASFADTELPEQQPAPPDDAVRSTLARADAALQRSEAVPGDDLSITGEGTSGADFDAYNAKHQVHGRLSGQHAVEEDEDTFRTWCDSARRINALDLYHQALNQAWANRPQQQLQQKATTTAATTAAPATVQPGSALDDMATVLRHSRSAADDAGPATWPDMTTPTPLPRLQTRHRVFIAWSFALAIFSGLWWAGVI